MRRSTCYAEAGPRRRPARQMPDSGAAKESNLPTLGLPGPAGFEGRRLQGFCACLGGFLFGWVRLAGVRFAEFGTRLWTWRIHHFFLAGPNGSLVRSTSCGGR